VPSATVLARLRATARTASVSRALLAVAAPGRGADAQLPGAAAEGRWLASRFADVDLRADGARMTAAELARYGVLHFATHAVVDDQHPWRSGVHVGGGEGEDPYLRASSIAATRLPARLAVIAGCESAGGRVLSGEGVQGLAAAFLSAGVPSVVASLWPVDDRATALLVEELYRRLGRGQSVSASLAGAQAALRSGSRTADPFYWAGFVVVGEPGATVALVGRPGLPGAASAAAAAAAAALLGWALARAARRRGSAGGDSA
jgi:CHAT domain-containing protein